MSRTLHRDQPSGPCLHPIRKDARKQGTWIRSERTAMPTFVMRSPQHPEIVAAPGNAGIARDKVRCLPVEAEDLTGIVAAAREERVDLVVVGPEAPLVAGVVDMLAHAGVRAFGPSAAAARIEG